VTLLARLGLQSRPQFGIFAKFAPSFAKLPKLQTPNAKPLDTSFGTFWQITQMQTLNAKPLEILLFLQLFMCTLANSKLQARQFNGEGTYVLHPL